MKKRRGYTLIETLVVIAGSGAVLATTTVLMHSMFKADGATRDRAAVEQTLRRLTADFRDDAHAAVKLSATPAVAGAKQPAAWDFQMSEPAHKVRYEAVPGRLIREEQQSGKLVRREVYRLTTGAAAAIRQENGPPALAVLQVAGTDAASGRSAASPLRVEAALGSDHRFAKLGEK